MVYLLIRGVSSGGSTLQVSLSSNQKLVLLGFLTELQGAGTVRLPQIALPKSIDRSHYMCIGFHQALSPMEGFR